MREFEVTFKSMLGMVFVVAMLVVMTIPLGISTKEYFLVALGVSLFSWLLLVRLRFKIQIGEDEIVSSTILSTRYVKLSELEECFWAHSHRYPKNRFFGPSTYTLRTSTESVYINFKFYPLECGKAILEKTKKFHVPKPK